ncbi:MAG TPA: FAD/NAD(P)-binding protein [Steroidobacteraceae bacterium]|nr:FAD/NAD(P)-binding protein [Steroidobacteraceae bacterium]
MRSPTRTIVIVGAGFSGTVLAANLLQKPPRHPTRIVLVEQRSEIGRGIAYQRAPEHCLLNVPAGRMSADSRNPAQFVRFAQNWIDNITASDFLPRRLYGQYLQDLLLAAERTKPNHVYLDRKHGQVRAILRNEDSRSYLVELSSSERLRAEVVVLACGDPPPVCAAFARAVERHPNYVVDPYGEGAIQPNTRMMLIVGTGLTAADTIVTAAALSPGIIIHAVSRHGLLPAEQSGSTFCATERDVPKAIADAPYTARRLLHEIRSQARALERRGGDWRDAMTIARYTAPRMWRNLPPVERKRFLRHARTHWDVHRHRLPPVVAARLRGLREAGQLHVHGGHILDVQSEQQRLRVLWRPRGTARTAQLLADRVVQCAGADGRLEQTRDPLLKGLLTGGLATADGCGIGLRTGRYGTLVDRHGRDCRQLFYLGPMLRAGHWEATAVGELRTHAEQLASSLAMETEEACTAHS